MDRWAELTGTLLEDAFNEQLCHCAQRYSSVVSQSKIQWRSGEEEWEEKTWRGNVCPNPLRHYSVHTGCSNIHLSLSLKWRHNGHNSVSNHQPHDCLLNCLFRRISKETSNLHVIDLCEENSPVTGELTAQRASYAENVSICWRHHGADQFCHFSVLCCIQFIPW